MFEFHTTGTVESIITLNDNKGMLLRLRCPTAFLFDRQGEMPSKLAVRCAPALVAGLPTGAKVKITGEGAVGVHDWKKPPKFNQEPQVKSIENTYFLATKLEVVK